MASPPIRLLKTAFVTYQHADLAKARQFLLDFGLTIAQEQPGCRIYFKGYGTEPYIYIAEQSSTGASNFGGAAYVVDSASELDRASRLDSCVGGPGTLEGPGGGQVVSLKDPAGHIVHLIHGWTENEADSLNLPKLVVNFEDSKPRRGTFQRFQPGPAPVFRWGHYGVTYPAGKYQAMFEWYTQTIALAPSDVVYRGEDPVTCFFHVDRGLEYTDHHAFFFKPAKPGDKPAVAHAAFEVHDFDVQQLGHQYLVEKKYELCWGVGRHVLGSQVFDYWFDTSGFIVEHYADGDLVNKDTPVAHVPAGPQSLSVWGPPVPSVF
ncbi:hypothetical protein B0A48_07148 [Cryoendolithus antarcticus]|uniref:VOC domain-containing protein n=1 Tax=Cryoendolithus antarcticus TaxID=1507870 RepID=A0A1V8T870_9PEZI|nr:hypothetical protein B0A48_07148 [Cryoendolithus antarcticus]